VADLFLVADLQPLVGPDGFDTDLATAARDVATGVVLGYCRLADVPVPTPLPLIAVGKRVAARLYENPTDLRSQTLSGYSATYSPALDEFDRMVLDVVSAQAGSGRALSVQLDF
jgi:hypothetical protein